MRPLLSHRKNKNHESQISIKKIYQRTKLKKKSLLKKKKKHELAWVNLLNMLLGSCEQDNSIQRKKKLQILTLH